MKIETRPLADIKPYDQNPRDNDAAVDAVAQSIRQFGFRQAIVVDGDGVIVCGHTRWKAAQKLGLAKAPVHIAKDLSPEQIRAYRIADNKSHELSSWDFDLLKVELTDLQSLDVDLADLGFTVDELNTILDVEVKGGFTDCDNIPAPPDEAATRRGDIWMLGDHRLMCGDSGVVDDVDCLLDGASIHLVTTDPPYGVRVESRSNNAIATGKRKNSSKQHHQQFDLKRHPKKSRRNGNGSRPACPPA